MDLKEIVVTRSKWVVLTRNRDYWRALVNVAWDVRAPLTMELVCFRVEDEFIDLIKNVTSFVKLFGLEHFR